MKHSFLFAGNLFLLFLAACAKSDSSSPDFPPVTNLRIATVKEESVEYTLLHTLYYSADASRVDSILTTGEISQKTYFTYAPNYTLIKRIPGDTLFTGVFQDSVVFDAARRQTAIYNNSQGMFTNSFFFYNTAGQLDKSVTTLFYGSTGIADTTIYVWNNGDLQSSSSSLAGVPVTYQYGSGPALPGNFVHLQLLLK